MLSMLAKTVVYQVKGNPMETALERAMGMALKANLQVVEMKLWKAIQLMIFPLLMPCP